MKANRFHSLVGCVALLSGLWAGHPNDARGAGDPGGRLVMPDAIQTALDRSGIVRVLVEFNLPAQLIAGKSVPATLIERTRAISAMQQQLLNRHFGAALLSSPASEPTRGLRLFEITPMFAISLDGQELKSLVTDPDVARVYPDLLELPALQDSVPLIGMTGAEGAYAYGATGEGQVVAVLDTGAQALHPFLAGKVISEACFSNAEGIAVSLCPNSAKTQIGPGAAEATNAACFLGAEELCKHGTHVAGIAAGKNPDPGIPPNGVAKEAELMVVQIFTRFNDADVCGGGKPSCVLSYVSDSLAGLEWVYTNMDGLGGERKLAAVNMSFGGGSYTSYCEYDPRRTVFNLLREAGVAPVAASGNEYQSNAIIAPACVPSAVAVGATTLDDTRALFSNQSQLMVDLMAPGVSILSSVPVSLYAYMSGTSMATPHVAGAFAAIKSRLPEATVNDIENALKNTGVPILSSNQAYTKPRIQVDAALAALGARIQRFLSVSKAGVGAILSDPPGIDCGPVCAAAFDEGAEITLTASPQTGYRFGEWSGGCTGTAATCKVSLEVDRNVAATFIQTFPLSVSPNGQGTVVSDPQGIECGSVCSHDFDVKSSVILTANPAYGTSLGAWSGACAGTSLTCQVTMDAAKTVSASYVELPKVLLKVVKPVSGEISSTPAGIHCGGKNRLCKAQFPRTSEVLLSAMPKQGFKVKKWAGCTRTEGDNCWIVVNQPVNKVKVSFSRLPKYALTLAKTGLGAVNSDPAGLECRFNKTSCTARFFQGTRVSLLPVAQTGHTFQEWEGACSGTAGCTLLMDGKQVVKAYFQ